MARDTHELVLQIAENGMDRCKSDLFLPGYDAIADLGIQSAGVNDLMVIARKTRLAPSTPEFLTDEPVTSRDVTP